MILALLQKQMLDELVVQLAVDHLTGVQVRGGSQHARRDGILVQRLAATALWWLCLLHVGDERPVQGGRDTDMQHATAQYEQRAMEATILGQMLDQYGQHEAACRCARHADPVGQGAMLVEVLGDDDDARRGRQTAANAWPREGGRER